MHSLVLLPFIAALGYALPQDACLTTTQEVIVPTETATYSTVDVVTEYPTGARDLGTFTLTTTISSTTTLATITSTASTCGKHSKVVTVPYVTETAYTNAAPEGYTKRALGLHPRDAACTVTVTSTTTYGQTYTFVPNGKTSTFNDYTAFTQQTVTSTRSGGKAYAIATGFAKVAMECGHTTTTQTALTTTVTMDARCSPSAITSSYQGFGLEILTDTPSSGAAYVTNTTDASACCQLCTEIDNCASSAWDIRSGACHLDFPVDPTTGTLDCGQGLTASYDAGPDHPMSPGTGWYVVAICGNVEFVSAPPDDGT